MIKRKPVPKDIQDELLFRSGRRCCVCFGQNYDFGVKNYGQIAHLNRNSTDNRLDNLAYLCPEHYSQYETLVSQSQTLTIRDVKLYRERLYAEVDRTHKQDIWPVGLELPELRLVDPPRSLAADAAECVYLADRDRTLYVSIQFRLGYPQTGLGYNGWNTRRGLHVTVTMRPALTLHFEVRTWDDGDANTLVRLLREGGPGCDLHGAGPEYSERQSRDTLYLWQNGDGYRLAASTFTATSAGISIHARFGPDVAHALADFLERVGFAAVAEV